MSERRRDEDKSFWFRFAYLAEKYKLLVWLGVALLMAFGFDFQTPATAQHKLQYQIDTLKKKVDTLQDQQKLLKDIMKVSCLGHAEQVICEPYLGRK